MKKVIITIIIVSILFLVFWLVKNQNENILNTSSSIPGQAFNRDCNKYTNGNDAFCKCWYNYLRTKYTVAQLKEHVIDTQDVSDAKAACLH